MWQQMAGACDELATGDEERIRALWQQLTDGGLLRAGRDAAADAPAEALPVLIRCAESLSASEARCVRACPELADAYSPANAAYDVDVTVVALLAHRCAAGEDALAELVRRMARLASQDATSAAVVPPPAVPGSASGWFRRVEAQFPAESVEAYFTPMRRVWRELASIERREILAAVADAGERTALAKHLERFGPQLGLNLTELRHWPDSGEFPACNAISEYQGGKPTPWPALERLAASADAQVRFVALLLIERHVDAHAAMCPRGFLPLLTRALNDDRPALRGLGLRAASRLTLDAPDRLSRRVGVAMADPVGAVRIEAARAAVRSQRVTRRIYDGLTSMLASPDADVRREAAAAASTLGMRMARRGFLSGLVPLLREQDAVVATQAAKAARALAMRLTPAMRCALVAQLRSPSADVRRECVRAIGAAGRRASRRRAIEATLALFDDAIAEVRREAIVAFGAIRRPEADPPTEALARRLGDGNAGVREAAARLTGQIGRRVLCSPIVGGLAGLLHGQPDEVSLAALVAAANLGLPAASTAVVAGTIDLLLAGNRRIGEQACRTAESLAVTEVLSRRLAAMLRSGDRKEQDACIGSLIRVGESAGWECFVDELLSLLRDAQPAPRAAAAYALEWLGPKAATPAVVARLEELRADASSSVRFHAADALARLRP